MEPSGICILIVEDSAIQAESLRRILVAEGYSVSVAKDGAEGLTKAREIKPDLVVSDIQMPAMDGFELCRSIKSDEIIKNIPVILLTQLSDPTHVIKSFESGAECFIFKTDDNKLLLSKAYDMLSGSDSVRSENTEVVFAGSKFETSQGNKKILDFLGSSYEAVVHKNNELISAQEALIAANNELKASTDSLANIVEKTTDGIIIVDSNGILKYCNRSAKLLLHRTDEDLLHAKFGFPVSDDHLMEIDIVGPSKEPITVEMKSNKTQWEGSDAYVIVLRDMTQRKRYEESLKNAYDELQNSNEELQAALDNVRTLSGMLPICSTCKKIRDDKGYWSGVETYISKHSEVLFSHGMCPECAAEAYSEIEKIKLSYMEK